MKTIIADKIASVAQHLGLKRKLQVSANIPCEEGVLVAARILNSKSSYNTLELTSGRMAKVSRGDIIVGALGHRKALFGYSGHLPEQLSPGDTVQVLNIGGVLGICDSVNANFGQPFDAEVLGTVLDFPYLGERIGVPARAGIDKLELDAPVETCEVPVVVLAGTSMDSGKTLVTTNAINQFEETETDFRLIMMPATDRTSFVPQDTWLATIMRFGRHIYRPDFTPVRVGLRRPEPKKNKKAFMDFFQAPIDFGCDTNMLVFDKQEMQVQLPAANAELARQNDQVVLALLARMDRDDIIAQVRASVVDLLPSGECSKENIASRLNMSERTLQGRLATKNTSYRGHRGEGLAT